MTAPGYRATKSGRLSFVCFRIGKGTNERIVAAHHDSVVGNVSSAIPKRTFAEANLIERFGSIPVICLGSRDILQMTHFDPGRPFVPSGVNVGLRIGNRSIEHATGQVVDSHRWTAIGRSRQAPSHKHLIALDPAQQLSNLAIQLVQREARISHAWRIGWLRSMAC